MRKIDKIIIHCSATAEGRPFTVEDVRRWHTAPKNRGGNGWSDIGYHYVIHLDGSIHPGRPEIRTGAHCTGQNRNSIGICYIGGCKADGRSPKDTRTEAQRIALRWLVKELCGRYPGATVHGHNEFAAKACPCFDVASQL